MDNLLIDCSVLNKFINPIKDLLKHKFKVSVKVEHLTLSISGNKETLKECQKVINYFKNANSQYLLAVGNFSKDALKINDLILLFECKCNVLILLDESTLHLYGELTNVNLIYNFLLKYDRLVSSEKVEFVFTDEEENRLLMLCSKSNIRLPKNTSFKSRIFVYNVLLDSDRLFNQSGIIELCSDFGDSPFCVDKSVKSEPLKVFSDVDKDFIPESFMDNKINVSDDNISKYRTIIIDGSNLAFGHGGDKFSCMGIKIAIDYFVKRGHSKIYALLPRHRQPQGGPLFEMLERADRLKYTPSRRLNNIRETPYDDRFILDAAVATGGVVLSNDQYRDLMAVEKYREIICNRLIPYTFIEDHIIIPDDPRGHNGPSLTIILSNPVISTTTSSNISNSNNRSTAVTSPRPQSAAKSTKKPVKQQQQQQQQREKEKTLGGHQLSLYNRVSDIFPEQSRLIKQIILGNPDMKDTNTIINYVLMAIPQHEPQQQQQQQY